MMRTQIPQARPLSYRPPDAAPDTGSSMARTTGYQAHPWPTSINRQRAAGYCQVNEKLVDRPPRYWARASREPAMLGIKNGRRPQLDNTVCPDGHRPVVRDTPVKRLTDAHDPERGCVGFTETSPLVRQSGCRPRVSSARATRRQGLRGADRAPSAPVNVDLADVERALDHRRARCEERTPVATEGARFRRARGATIPAKRADKLTPRPRDTRVSVLSFKSYWARSMPLMWVQCRSARSPSCSWDRPCAVLSLRTCRPSARRTPSTTEHRGWNGWTRP